MANRAPLPYPVFQAFDGNGDPLSGGTVTFYDAGTTTERDIYSDEDLSTTLPNPVTLNSRGEPESGGGTAVNIYLDEQPYKIVLKDSDDSTVRTVDNYIHAPLQSPSSSADPSLAFDTWRTPDSNRPVLVELSVEVETDGNDNGEIHLEIDESGGTTSDYSFKVIVEASTGNGTINTGELTALIPAGGAYRINNSSDPDSLNQILENREVTL